MYESIRVLPMSKEEFDNIAIEELQYQFFLKDLPFREDEYGKGKFCYKSSKMKTKEETTLVLFQYDNHIIALARLLKIVDFKKPQIQIKEEKEYKGAYYFEPSSIVVFEPLSAKEISDIFHKNIQFGQAKHSLDIKYIDKFFKNLSKKVCLCKKINL